MREDRRRIWTPKGAGVMLARRFQVSPEWVSKSLAGKNSGSTSRNIRAVAVKEYGGKYIGE